MTLRHTAPKATNPIANQPAFTKSIHARRKCLLVDKTNPDDSTSRVWIRPEDFDEAKHVLVPEAEAQELGHEL